MKKKIFKLILITLILIALDQLSKMLALNLVTDSIGNDFVKFEIAQNTGMAFGLNEGNFKNILISTCILLVVINFIKNQIERVDNKTIIALSFVLAGGISNLIDRIFRGFIVDFIYVYKFAIFNLADVFVVIGWLLLIVFLIDFSRKK